MGIDNFFGAKRIDIQKKVEEFRSKSNDKQTEREFERRYLKPEPIPDYTGKQPMESLITRLSVRLIFPTKEDLELFSKHFRVAQYVEASVTNIGLLLAFVHELEKGRLRYDKETGRIRYTIQRRNRK